MARVVLLLSVLLHGAAVLFVVQTVSRTDKIHEAPQPLAISLLAATAPIEPSAPPPPAKAPAPVAPPASKAAVRPPSKSTDSAMPATAVRSPSSEPSAAPAVEAAPAVSSPAVSSPAVTSPATNNVSPTTATNTTPAPPSSPVRQAVGIDASYAASNPVPPYPPIARRLGEQGTVVLRILVGADGSARDVQIKKSSGSATLDRSAETTIKQWRFNPAKIDGKPVEEWYETRWTFKLEG